VKSAGTTLIVVLAAFLLAGCTGASTGAVAKTSVPPAPSPTHSADTGSVVGTVTNDELAPIPGAQVALIDVANATALTDAKGAFTFSDMPPGDHNLAASKVGYIASTKRVTVIAGQTANATILLTALVVNLPRQETFMDDGFINLAAAVPSVYFGGAGPIGKDKVSFDHNATNGAMSIVTVGRWDRSAPLTASWMRIGLQIESGAFNTSQGKAAVATRVDEVPQKEKVKFTVTFSLTHVCTNGTSCAEDPPNRVAQVAYQQKTKVQSSVFYVDPAPAGFVPGSAP
jgi:hypothetical protein